MTLRHGFTTGTAASAAAKAAATHLLTGRALESVEVPLPIGERMSIAILESRIDGDAVVAAVVKDAGDDPDVTHRAVIRARVQRGAGSGVTLRGGSGVGVVTRPGLPVAIGMPAINPVPREQITKSVTEALDDALAPGASESIGLEVEIRVDRGEELARKTFNPRLGIVGGISILGTRGTVKPFSNAAYQATIRQCLDVMQACGVTTPCLTTGGRSERFLRQARAQTPETACVQVADFFSYSMREVGRRGFGSVLWGVFFGKLVKQAQGHRYTHARSAELDLGILADWCADCGFDQHVCREVAGANTAMQALELLSPMPRSKALFTLLTNKAADAARTFCGRDLRVDYMLFDFTGQILHQTREAA
ncbi:MAG: cobalt-precorrin-5B (C(1))-methyltransferase [Desulfomicrobium apsheronum]|nr:cobalt-precorrin-5B (C(1))-methyltransferase [Desulfomicrobium apsheronum]